MHTDSNFLYGMLLVLLVSISCQPDTSESNAITPATVEKNISEASRAAAPHTGTEADTMPAGALLDSARRLFNAGRHDRAMEKARQATALYQKVSDKTKFLLVQSLNLKSQIFQQTGRLDSALISAKQALAIVLQRPGEDRRLEANTYDNLGIVLYLLGDYDQSLGYLEKALEMELKTLGPDHPVVADSYHKIGILHSVQGAYDRGLSYYEKALATTLKNFGPDHPNLGRTHNNMGINYENKEDYEQALHHYQKALEILLKNLGPDHPMLSSIYGNLGDLFHGQKAHDRALNSYQKGLDILLKNPSADQPAQAWIYQGLAAVYHDLGSYEQALALYEKALKLRVHSQRANHPLVADVFNHTGKVYLSKGETRKAFHLFRKAGQVLNYDFQNPSAFHQVPDLKSLHAVLRNLETYYLSKMEQTGDSRYLDSLYHHYRTMLALEEHIQREYTSSSIRQVYAARSLPVYEGAIANLLQRNHPGELSETFVLAEKTKSRQLAEKVQSAPHTVSFGIPDSLQEKERALNINIAYYEKKAFQEAYGTKAPADSLLNVYNSTVFDLREERENLLEFFKTKYPAYYRLRYSPQVIDITGVQKDLLQHGYHALAEYFVGDRSIYLFVVLPDTFEVFEIERDFPLERWITELRCGLFADYLGDPSCDSLTAAAAQQLYAQRAHALYRKLFAPVDELLPDGAGVLLIPDGPIGYLPFEALLTRHPAAGAGFYQYPYLLRDHLISYAYSATLQREMQNKKHRKPPHRDLVAFAPNFAENDSFTDSTFFAARFTNPHLLRNRLTPLRFNREEAETVAATFGGKVLAGPEATEAAFLENAPEYRILHLATHSKANDRAGDYSFLAFQPLDDSLENEWLYNRELYNLQLNADLVVLSACETGIGELQRGEGIISLARGFGYAGAKSLVTSLWNVSDQHTLDLMTYFYSYLKKGLPKHQALRQAKLDYLDKHEGHARSPFFWAGFIPIGDMRPVESSRNEWGIALAAFGVLLSIAALLWRRRPRYKN